VTKPGLATLALLCALLWATAAAAQSVTRTATASANQLQQQIARILARPLFKHAGVGLEVLDLTSNQALVAINQDKLFTAGSTTKLVTMGAALALLGPDYRFHTRVYATGPITRDGTLEGDIVLVASGDPNLSGRVQENDTLDFVPFDHSYAGLLPGESVVGDPLHVLKDLAIGVFKSGIGRIHGRVLVDASLFPSTHVEPATHAAISPVVLNDNVVDVRATPGSSPGAPVALDLRPDLPYLKVINHVTSGAPNSDPELRFTSDIAEADGSHTVVLEGSVPAGGPKAQAAYKVPDPVLYARVAFREALRWMHIEIDGDSQSAGNPLVQPPGLQRKLVAEHVSPPLSEEVKMTLKVSQNLHAATMPYLLGSIAGHASTDALGKGLALERRFLSEAGLHPEEVSQLDGEGGMGSAFSPDFMVRYLAFILRQPYGKVFFQALPVLGRDGTLAEVLQDSPAAGHVHAKTGSYIVADALNGRVMLLGKGLAGYVDAKNGHRLAFAAYVNMLPLRDIGEVGNVAESLAQIAEAVYEFAPAGQVLIRR
jgi:PBP4 family serine-type D-alanyl-D-alanine carboxypeptidase